MSKPDCLVVIAKDTDYPLFRFNMRRFKEYFNEIYIAVSDNGTTEDFTQFFVTALPEAHFKFIPRAEAGKDWRDVAVNTLLEKSTASNVLFLEPDFLIRDERVFEVILNTSMDYNTVLYDEGGRIHPAFCFTERALVDQTSKDFSANPPLGDHFYKFFKELMKLGRCVELEDIGLHNREDFYHMAGLTQSYHAQPFYKPNEFLTYNRYAQKLPVPYGEFVKVMEKIDKEHPFLLNDVILSMFPREVRD